MTIGIPLVFPNGHLLSKRWRWAAAGIVLLGVGSLVQGGFAPRVIPDMNVENPFYIEGLGPLLSVVKLPEITGVVVFLLPIAAVAIRYRRGSVVEREQLKWLIAVTAFAAVAWIVVIVGGVTGSTAMAGIGWVSALLAFTGFPIAIGIAVLRYRLYEIDRIISRTIAWALVTGILVAIFALGVIALQAALVGLTQGNTIAVAVSTLVAAALFQPLRRRVQQAVDRRFDRARYDGERTVQALGAKLRDETDLARVRRVVLAAATDTVRPSRAALWLRSVSS